LTPEALLHGIADNPTAVHTVQPRAVSISQATELGTVYTPDELRALSTTARSHGLLLHMDGARFANAVASLGCTPAEASAGVDVLSFGATKNGALAAEAVVFFDRDHAADFEFRRKRAGHLFSKMRYVAAQWLAYLDDGLWLRLAARANAHARRIGEAAGTLRLEQVEANEIFLRLTTAEAESLRSCVSEKFDSSVMAGLKPESQVRLHKMSNHLSRVTHANFACHVLRICIKSRLDFLLASMNPRDQLIDFPTVLICKGCPGGRRNTRLFKYLGLPYSSAMEAFTH
jgi:threonine aldolase